jgi:ABC-type polysaccharide/polyol phosphate transport system ATPase subunit
MTTSPINIPKVSLDPSSEHVMRLDRVSKKYPSLRKEGIPFHDIWALRDISLEVKRGEILGIIGRNGAGKTTLLNIMAQVLSVTEGEVVIKDKVMGLFNLGVGFQNELTGRENIFLNGAILGAKEKELKDRFDSIAEFSELGRFIDMPLGVYSQGMRLRLAFSIVISLEFDILVIDEVLAVGDALFQSKCFGRLMDFKRNGKTLVITSQGMDLIERLCDRVVLLDHGKSLFQGDPLEGINRYRLLLNTEKFTVDPIGNQTKLVENTKKWADDASGWGKELGTKEVVIKKVEFLNGFGMRVSRIKSGGRLKIKVYFTARNPVKEPHFGIAIFRNDGVYCYGPNTKFDGLYIRELRKGDGYFALDLPKVWLAPGEYRISIAIWDKKETLAFNYHEGYYKMLIRANHSSGNGLLNMPFGYREVPQSDQPDLQMLNGLWGKKIESDFIRIESVKFFNKRGEEKVSFVTNEPVRLEIRFNKLKTDGGNLALWVGIYRDDGIYCQAFTQSLRNNNNLKIHFSRLPLLPGGYRVSAGIWDSRAHEFVTCHHGLYQFRTLFNREDHGTVYLEHKWSWKTLQKK